MSFDMRPSSQIPCLGFIPEPHREEAAQAIDRLVASLRAKLEETERINTDLRIITGLTNNQSASCRRCNGVFLNPIEVYRCVECGLLFHKHCAISHFTEAPSIGSHVKELERNEQIAVDAFQLIKAENATLTAQLESAKQALVCDVCLGKPLESGAECICFGTGLLAEGFTQLRQAFFREMKEKERLQAQLGEERRDNGKAAAMKCAEILSAWIEMPQNTPREALETRLVEAIQFAGMAVRGEALAAMQQKEEK